MVIERRGILMQEGVAAIPERSKGIHYFIFGQLHRRASNASLNERHSCAAKGADFNVVPAIRDLHLLAAAQEGDDLHVGGLRSVERARRQHGTGKLAFDRDG
jgi:hypothetical protein